MFEQLSALPSGIHTSLGLIFGLLVGSFLNVVIYRYPKILKYQWSAQSYEWLNEETYPEPAPPGIVSPSSHCGVCKTPVRAWHNIPVLSYIVLGGTCASCKAPYSIRYPFVELLTGILCAYVVHTFGWSLQSLCGILLTCVLVALTFIDFDHQLLPDDLALRLALFQYLRRLTTLSLALSQAIWHCGWFFSYLNGSLARKVWAMVISSS